MQSFNMILLVLSDKKLLELVGHITVIFMDNRSNGDTSMKFGMNSQSGSLIKKNCLATQNFKMAAIFQDGRHFP